LADGEIMKENIAVLVALAALVLPWVADEAEGTSREPVTAPWGGIGMPPEERYADWS
jgi:hypothetical protein